GRADPARVAARAALDRAIGGTPRLAGLIMGEILRAAADRYVARGWFHGQEVILKLYPGAQGPKIVEATVKELQVLARIFDGGAPRAQVVRCLEAVPEQGLVVLTCLPGDKLSRRLPR